MARVVKLREVLAKQRRSVARDYAADLRCVARELEKEFAQEASGYCVVIWKRDGEHRAYWNGVEELQGAVPLPDFVANALRRHLGILDTRRDQEQPPDEGA